MRAVAVIPAAGLITGSAVGLLVPEVSWHGGIALLLLAGGGGIVAWRTGRPTALGFFVGGGFLIGGAMLSASASQQVWRPSLRPAFEELARRERAQAAREGRRLPEDDEAFAIVEGTLRADAAATESGIAISLDVDAISTPSPGGGESAMRSVEGGVQATVVGSLGAGRMGEWRAGRRLRVPLQLHRANRYEDPGVPDFERALARRGTTLVGTAKSAAVVDLIARGSRLDETVASVRAYARRAIAQAVGSRSPRSGAIVAAIVIGDRAGLDDEVVRRLQEAGTYHVIAISGGNIAILAGLLLGAFRLAGLLGRTAMIGAVAVLIAYARLVGGSASVDRATLMAVVYFAARAIDHRSSPLNTLALVASCLVAASPLAIVDPAFVLTFGATVAILLAAPVVRSWEVPPRLAPAVTLLAASVAAEAMLLPVGALVFSRVTFAGLALNFVAIPLMAVVQIAGMALVPAALMSTHAAAWLGYVAHVAATGLVRSAELTRLMPLVIFRVAPPAAWIVATYYGGMVVFWVGRRNRAWRWAGSAVVGVCAIWIVAEPWAMIAARGDGRLHTTFIDVGQGDAALVRFPRGATMVVDTGGLSAASTFDMGDRVVAPVLREAGLRRLDWLVLTHGHPDHIGGAASLIREFRPRQVWDGIPVPSFEPLRLLAEDARAVGAGWVTVKSGDRAVIDEVEVGVRHPSLPDWERQQVRNDDSIVLELQWHDVSVLLTGDIGPAVERTLLASIRAVPLRVIKVPHHGARTSSTPAFVGAVAPRVAVVSAGRANHFGHPAPDVIARYQEAGAEVFRTDRDGAVTIDTDGYTLSVRTFTGRSLNLLPRQ